MLGTLPLAWSVTGHGGSSPSAWYSAPSLVGGVGTGGSSGRPGCMLGTLSAAWAVLGPAGRPASATVRYWAPSMGELRAQAEWSSHPSLHARNSSEQPGWWQGQAGHPAGQTFMLGFDAQLGGDMARRFVQVGGLARSVLCCTAWWWRCPEGLSSLRTCTLSTLPPGLGCEGLRVVQAAGLALDTLPACFGWWRGQWFIQPARHTLGTLSSSLGSGRARRVVQPARLAGSVLARVLAGRRVILFGRTLHTRHSVEGPGL